MMSNCEPTDWKGLYSQAFDLMNAESVAHPAKMSAGLCFRIFEHLEELGLLKVGDTILDPMAGTGLTALVAAVKGYPAITVELEERFVGFQKGNKSYIEAKLHHPVDWQIIQGDSRKLSELLTERGLRAVMSPPYQDAQGHPSLGSVNKDSWGKDGTDIVGRRGLTGEYGTSPGQIGAMKDKPLVGITSPPYGEAVNSEAGGIDWQKAGRPDRLPENLSENARNVMGTKPFKYSSNPSNIGNLADKPLKAVMSPPYENQQFAQDKEFYQKKCIQTGRSVDSPHQQQYGEEFYGQSEGQIGKEQSESYLEAMKVIYQEIAKVASVLVVVTKNPTRNGALRRLDLDTIALLEQTGWKIRCHHKALLFEEIEQTTLFGDTRKKVKGRMSFFKRLSWQKGSPVAEWEDVIICERER